MTSFAGTVVGACEASEAGISNVTKRGVFESSLLGAADDAGISNVTTRGVFEPSLLAMADAADTGAETGTRGVVAVGAGA